MDIKIKEDIVTVPSKKVSIVQLRQENIAEVVNQARGDTLSTIGTNKTKVPTEARERSCSKPSHCRNSVILIKND